MHLYIELNTGLNETVAPSVVSNLYDLAIRGLDSTSDLIGTINTDSAAINKVEYLNNTFGPDFLVTATTYTLAFEDSAVEALCISNWGSNGGVTANQLALVSTTGDVFKNNTDIIKFNEFKYFTNVNTFSFFGCTNLREITLPSNKTSLPDDAFNRCTGLLSFDLSNITSVGVSTFYGCSTTQFSSLDHIVSYGHDAFHGCSTVTSVEFPANVFIGYSAFCESGVLSITFKGDFLTDTYGGLFESCNNLTSVTFETQFSALPFRFFRKCGALQTVDLSNCLSYRVSDNDPYFGGHFSECGSLITVTLSPHVNRLETGMFEYCNIQRITIPANVTEIGNKCFNACRNLTVTCLPTTPPTLVKNDNESYNHFGMVPSIKVPAASLEAYKTATGWSTWAGNITAIA